MNPLEIHQSPRFWMRKRLIEKRDAQFISAINEHSESRKLDVLSPKVIIYKGFRRGAFLIEVLLAFTIFMTVGVACVVAFNKIGSVAVLADQERIIMQELNNAILVTQTTLQQTTNKQNFTDKEQIIVPTTNLPNFTIKITTQVVEDLQNNQEQALSDIYHITATAYWGDSNLDQQQETLDTYTFEPN